MSRCGYCDFHSVAGAAPELVDRYLEGLELELRALGSRPRPTTVYVGGGTPTQLDDARFERLLGLLHDRIDWDACVEFSCEANPESVTARKLKLLAAAGTTRLSLGVQSFDPGALRFLERAHGVEEVRQAYDRAVASGIPELSLDLIFGLPGQELGSWLRDLEQAIELNPCHLSCYNLTIEAGTDFERATRQARWSELDPEAALDLFRATRELLGEAGYTAYEVSNYSRDVHPCRHNLNYWRAGDYVGLGPSAASHRKGCRSSNLKPVGAYVEAIQSSACACGEAETLSPRHRAGEALWLGLRLSEGADTEHILEMTGIDPRRAFEREIHGQCAAGRLAVRGSKLCLTERGLPQADAVGLAFLPGRSDVPRGTAGARAGEDPQSP